MSYTRKGNSSPAYRYFLFILFLCIVLFAFLMSRLASGMKTEIEYEQMIVPALRVLDKAPREGPIRSENTDETVAFADFPRHSCKEIMT